MNQSIDRSSPLQQGLVASLTSSAQEPSREESDAGASRSFLGATGGYNLTETPILPLSNINRKYILTCRQDGFLEP